MRISDWSSDVCSSDLPVRVIAQMIGIPLEDEPKFTGWAVRTLQEGLQNLADLPEVFEEMTAYFVQHVAARRAMAEGSRPDDILTMLLEAETDQPMTAEHLPGTCFLLLIPGLYPTWTKIGSQLLPPASPPQD